MAKRTAMQHWPVLVLGALVVVIFLAVLVTFEVKETEYGVVMTFGKPKTVMKDDEEVTRTYAAGLHPKWPYPFQTVWKHDKRLQCYELKRGQVEQIQTADDYQVVITTYVLWRVGDPGTFLRAVKTTEEAEDKLDDVVRNYRNTILGQHALTELINTDPEKIRIAEIEDKILAGVQSVALSKYGILVEHVGFKHLGFPERVSTKVFDRMRAERQRIAEAHRAAGRSRAQQIRAEADLKAQQMLAKAQAQATSIRAEGDKEAAEYYRVFQRNPRLASFLRKLDSLRKTLSEQTTLVVDTDTPPYDLLKPNAADLGAPSGTGEGAAAGEVQ